MNYNNNNRVLPPAIPVNPLPQPPDLRGPRPALCEKVMVRLPPPAAAPPALVQAQTLGSGHAVMEEGPDRGVTRKQLVIAPSQGLPNPA